MKKYNKQISVGFTEDDYERIMKFTNNSSNSSVSEFVRKAVMLHIEHLNMFSCFGNFKNHNTNDKLNYYDDEDNLFD